MKTLYLVRHGKSSWRHRELRDYERPLKKRGVNDAIMISEHLNDKGIKADKFISSPARRALQTATIFAENLKYDVDEIEQNKSIYGSTYSELLTIILGLDDQFKSVMIFGHDPTLANLASHLTTHVFEKISTSGVVAITFDAPKWELIHEGHGHLEFSIYPKMFT